MFKLFVSVKLVTIFAENPAKQSIPKTEAMKNVNCPDARIGVLS